MAKRRGTVHCIGIERTKYGNFVSGMYIREFKTEPNEFIFCVPTFWVLNQYLNYLIALLGDGVKDKIKPEQYLIDIYKKRIKEEKEKLDNLYIEEECSINPMMAGYYNWSS